MHVGSGFNLGNKSGQETVALTSAQTPSHTHAASFANVPANEGEVEDRLPAVAEAGKNTYFTGTPSSTVAMASSVISNAGGGQGHDNMQPYLALNFCIALRGLFPSRN